VQIVAVEGPCCAGKTTLSSAVIGLLESAERVVCYADFVGGGRNLPDPVPGTPAEDAASLERLLDIDEQRFAAVRQAALDLDLSLAVADRSAHTFLAHRRGVSQLNNLDLYTPAQTIVAGSTKVTWPDLVLYLDTPVPQMQRRNTGKFPADSIFMDPVFNAGFRDHFQQLRHGVEGNRFVWIDGSAARETVLRQAVAALRSRWPELRWQA